MAERAAPDDVGLLVAYLPFNKSLQGKVANVQLL